MARRRWCGDTAPAKFGQPQPWRRKWRQVAPWLRASSSRKLDTSGPDRCSVLLPVVRWRNFQRTARSCSSSIHCTALCRLHSPAPAHSLCSGITDVDPSANGVVCWTILPPTASAARLARFPLPLIVRLQTSPGRLCSASHRLISLQPALVPHQSTERHD